MIQNHKFSSAIILALVFLTPIFFIPGTLLSLNMSKTVLFVLGAVLALLAYMFELWRQGRMMLPKHPLVWATALLPVVYYLSAILATPSSLSLFGYGFEAGTFGFILIGSALLLLASIVFTDTSRTLRAITAFFLSVTILALFSAVKILIGGDALNMGNFFGVMGNPLGAWTDLGVVFGLLSVFSILALGMLPMKGAIRVLVYVVFALSLALMVVINFQTAFIFTLISSIALFFYFRKIEPANDDHQPNKNRTQIILPVILGLVSLLFIINPMVGEETRLGGVVSGSFGVNNTEIRPSFSATLGVSKAVLSQAGLLGSGPNTFGQDWLVYRPAEINATPFWSASFPFGAGFIPTQIATTGILGSALWLVFFAFLAVLMVKALSSAPELRGERFTLVFTLVGTLFLWVASFMYAPSASMLILAFIFTGIFLANLVQAGIISAYEVDVKRNSQTRFAVCLALIVLAAGSLSIGWTGSEKAISAFHFNKALTLSNVEGTPLALVEASLIDAINTSPTDVYFVALSRLNFTRAQMAANSATGTPEENRAIFDESLSRSIEAARLAVSTNPAGFENWVALGNIYTAMVPAPLSVDGAYENAVFAYNEAIRRNPNNPELPLLRAQLEIANEDIDSARAYIRNSIALKQDYADAYQMLAQLEIQAGNTAAAIASAENLAVLVPENPGIHFELGLLKYSSGNFAEALDDLNEALRLSPDYANAKYYKGFVLAQLGDMEGAIEEFESLLVSNPGNAEVDAALVELRAGRVPVPPSPESNTQAATQ